jgi:3-hydroxybutyryl-CoA dehydrogenase
LRIADYGLRIADAVYPAEGGRLLIAPACRQEGLGIGGIIFLQYRVLKTKSGINNLMSRDDLPMTIIVCGAGTMGSGIAETAVRSGFHTLLFDLDPVALGKAKSQIEKNLNLLIQKNKLSPEEKNGALAKLDFTTETGLCRGGLVIEAIVEKTGVKIDLFTKLASINNASTIFATNTSSLSVSAIAAGVPNPARVCGMHFFNPAQVMKLVEVVEGEKTDPKVIMAIVEVVKNMGKIPVTCKDAPGFIVNRVARHYYLEALKIVEEGITDMETADKIMESSGFKMGPFRLMDLIGNDINYSVSQSLYEAFGKVERFKPSALQLEKVNKKELGRKTGKGFYTY